MNHDQMHDRLLDYADGTLPAAEQKDLEMHLTECGSCRDELDSLRALLAGAHSLPRGITPPRDLWPEIAARVDRSKVVEVDFRPAAHGSPWPARGMLAAAAIVLVALSSAITASLVRTPSGGPIVSLPGVSGSPAEPVVTALAAFEPAEQEYAQTIYELAATLEAGRDVLAPETVAIIEENLRIIDRAIAESRAALEADPNNRELTESLSGVYRRKVDLLQSAVLLQSQT